RVLSAVHARLRLDHQSPRPTGTSRRSFVHSDTALTAPCALSLHDALPISNFKSATVLPCSVSYAYFVANHSEPKNKMRKAISPVINIKMLLNRNILNPTS